MSQSRPIVKVRFICNVFGINTYVLGNELPYLVSINISLWRDSCVHSFPGWAVVEVSGSIAGCL